MDVNFKYKDAGKAEPIYIESVIAEVAGGMLVANPSYDLKPSTALSVGSDGKLEPIKAYRLVADVASDATSIKIAKGSGIAQGDAIGKGKKAVACTAVDTSNAEYDLVTVTLGVSCKAGEVLYEASSASASSATPKGTAKFILGDYVFAGEGDKLAKVLVGGTLRKETALVANEVVASLPMIELV